MAPQLTDAQSRTDEAFDQYLGRWNLLNAAQKASPDGMQLRDLLLALARQRNGDDAARDLGKVLDPRMPPIPGPELRKRIDDRYPRADGPAGQAPAAPAAAGSEAGLPDSVILGSPIYNAEPGDGRVWLPGNATLPELSDTDTAALLQRDAAIQAINASLFKVDPALAWRPEGARLPVTGTNISTLGTTHDTAAKLLADFTGAVAALETAFSAASVEPLIAAQRDRVQAPLRALEDAAGSSMQLPDLISRGAIAANDGFHQLRGENLDIRRGMATTVLGSIAGAKQAMALTPGWSAANLTSIRINGAFAKLPAVEDPAKVAGVGAAAHDITALASHIATPAVVGKQDVTSPSAAGDQAPGTDSAAPSAWPTTSGGPAILPTALPGTAPTPAAAEAAAGAAKSGTGLGADELTKLLTQLGNTAVPLAQQAAQQAAAVPQQLAALPQQIATLPQQAANAVQRAVRPAEDALRQMRGDDPKNTRLTAADQAAAADAANGDRAAVTSVAYTPPKPAEAAALGAPGTAARAHQLDATGKPADRDGDGKVDARAVPLAKSTVKPFDLSVPADGQNVQVKGVPDPRVGEMMLDMADASGGKPLSVLDAAKAVGIDITALGDPMDPKLAKVGDAVIGDAQSGIYLGDDKVLTSTGLVESMSDVIGRNGFISEIPLPELPDNPPGGEGKDPAIVTVGTHDGHEPATQLAGTDAGAPAAPPPPSAPAAHVTPPPAAPAPPPAPAPAPPAPVAPPAPAPAPPAPVAPPAPAPAPLAPVAPPAPASNPAPTLVAAPAPPPGGTVPHEVPYEGRALG